MLDGVTGDWYDSFICDGFSIRPKLVKELQPVPLFRCTATIVLIVGSKFEGYSDVGQEWRCP
jgi:hypothetical protein